MEVLTGIKYYSVLGFEFLSHVCVCVCVCLDPTLCNPMDCTLSGSLVHRSFQARILECIAISFSRRFSWPRNWTLVDCIAGRFFMKWATRGALSASWGLCKNEQISWDNLGKEPFPHKYLCRLSNLVTGKEAEVTWVWREGESMLVLVCLFIFRGLYSPWNSSGQNTAVDSCSLLQGILPTQGSNPGLPHCRQILYQLSHQGSPHLAWNTHRKSQC